MVDLHRALLFGGTQHYHLLPNHVYILDVQQWVSSMIADSDTIQVTICTATRVSHQSLDTI